MFRLPAALGGDIRVLGRKDGREIAAAVRMTRERSLSTGNMLAQKKVEKQVKLIWIAILDRLLSK